MVSRSAVMLLLFSVIMGNMVRTGAWQNIRSVDALQLLSAGALLGVMLVTIAMHFKNKKGGA